MPDYNNDQLGIAAAHGNTVFFVVIIIIVAIIHIVEHAKLGAIYPSIQRRITVILIAPAWFAICALFGLYWDSVLVALFIDFYKALLIGQFTTYLLSFLAATREGKVLVNNHATLVRKVMEMGTVSHVGPLVKCFGKIEVDTVDKAEKFIRRIKMCVR